MKKFYCFWMMFLWAFSLGAAVRPWLHYDFSKVDSGGGVDNQEVSVCRARILGGYSRSDGGFVKLDGRTGEIELEGTEHFNIMSGATLVLLCRQTENAAPQADCFFSKWREFYFGERGGGLESSLFDGEDWCDAWWSGRLRRKSDGEWHHYVMTFRYHSNPNDGEDWIEQIFYRDGRKVGVKRRNHFRIPRRPGKLEIGSCSSQGEHWRLEGEIAQARVYRTVLSENEVRNLVLEQNLAHPAFDGGAALAESDRILVEQMKAPAPVKQALKNYIMATFPDRSWKLMLRHWQEFFLLMENEQSSLVLVKTAQRVHPFSLMDKKAGREIFAWSNALVSWQILAGGKVYKLNPLAPSVKSVLAEAPYRREDGWAFRISYKHISTGSLPFSFQAESDFVYNGRRLAFSHQIRPLETGVRIHGVNFPSFRFRALKKGTDNLLLPDGCGVEHPDPVARGVKWTQPYPRAFASMQCFGYYDNRRGIYFGVEDPRGRPRTYTVSAENQAVDMSAFWRVPYDHPSGSNEFVSGCHAAVELCEGSWYSVGKIYKRVLRDIDAPFFKKIPAEEQPSSIRDNCYWLHDYYYSPYLVELADVRDYIGLDAMQLDVSLWWGRGGMSESCAPLLRSSPDWQEYLRYMKKRGITAVLYTNGRLWSSIDRRGRDYLYTTTGRPAAVWYDGHEMIEKYGVDCAVVCPATLTYQKYFSDFLITLSAQGAEGIYLDQLGAAQWKQCQRAQEHGHRYYDWDAWLDNGYGKMIRTVRANWRRRGSRHFLSTEDNAEVFGGLIDACLTYRWSADGQVPLFPMVYAGRVQMYDRRAASAEARICTTAEQLLNGEQLGAFMPREFSFPFNHVLRDYAKKMIWLRHGLLPVFQEGEMGEPVEFLRPMRKIRRLWSVFRTRYVSKPEIQSGSWIWRGMKLVILVNTGDCVHRNIVRFSAPSLNRLKILDSRGNQEYLQLSGGAGEYAFCLQPREFLLLWAMPEEDSPDRRMLADRLNRHFGVISAVGTSRDQSFLKEPSISARPVMNPRNFHNLVDAPLIQGAARDRRKKAVTYNFISMIYAGEFDFGDCAPDFLELESSYEMSMEGVITVYAGDIRAENVVAEVILPKYAGTGGLDKFKVHTALLRKALTGRQKIIFTADGFFSYHLRSWRVGNHEKKD